MSDPAPARNTTSRASLRPAVRSELPPLQTARLLDQLRERVRYLHYSLRTEEAYVYWCRAFIKFHGLRHPRELQGEHVEAFLGWLVAERHVAASTHRQALSALLFLYTKVLDMDLPWMNQIGRPRSQRRLPVVLTVDEINRVIKQMNGQNKLLAALLYGTGLRLLEGLRLRVKDVDFGQRALIVREGKGSKDRVVMLPLTLIPALHVQLAQARMLWARDREDGRGGVHMPDCERRPRSAAM